MPLWRSAARSVSPSRSRRSSCSPSAPGPGRRQGPHRLPAGGGSPRPSRPTRISGASRPGARSRQRREGHAPSPPHRRRPRRRRQPTPARPRLTNIRGEANYDGRSLTFTATHGKLDDAAVELDGTLGLGESRSKTALRIRVPPIEIGPSALDKLPGQAVAENPPPGSGRDRRAAAASSAGARAPRNPIWPRSPSASTRFPSRHSLPWTT